VWINQLYISGLKTKQAYRNGCLSTRTKLPAGTNTALYHSTSNEAYTRGRSTWSSWAPSRGAVRTHCKRTCTCDGGIVGREIHAVPPLVRPHRTTAFHTYAILWNPADAITFLVDDVPVIKVRGTSARGRAHLPGPAHLDWATDDGSSLPATRRGHAVG
jgi:hypothetical protein